MCRRSLTRGLKEVRGPSTLIIDKAYKETRRNEKKLPLRAYWHKACWKVVDRAAIPVEGDIGILRAQNLRFFFVPCLLFSSSSRFNCSRFSSARSRLLPRGEGGDSGCFESRLFGSGDFDAGFGDLALALVPPIWPSLCLLGDTVGFEAPPILPNTPFGRGGRFCLVLPAGSGELDAEELLSSLLVLGLCWLSRGCGCLVSKSSSLVSVVEPSSAVSFSLVWGLVPLCGKVIFADEIRPLAAKPAR